MTRRIILCEGPDDLTALREIALFIFKAQKIDTQSQLRGPAGVERKVELRAGSVAIQIKCSERRATLAASGGSTVSPGGKDALPRLAATQLMIEPTQTGAA